MCEYLSLSVDRYADQNDQRGRTKTLEGSHHGRLLDMDGSDGDDSNRSGTKEGESIECLFEPVSRRSAGSDALNRSAVSS